MNNFELCNPVKVVFGKGSIARLSALIPEGSKVLMVYGGGSIKKNGIYGHGRERYDAVLEVFDQQKDSPSNDTAWAALKAASQEPNPESITSNTQWSIAYNNTDLTAEIIIRRHWEDMTRYSLTAGAAK